MKKIITLCLLAFIGTTTLNAQCFKKVAASANYSVAIKTDGTLWACGFNQYGQFGNGTTSTFATYFTKIGNETNWADIFCCSSNSTGNHTMGLKTDGTLWAWGLNTYGQLGIGNTTNQSTPVQVSLPNGKFVANISLGGNHTLALMTDGTLYSWGYNSNGQLGIGNTNNSSYPVQVSLPNGLIASGIATGGGYSFAIMTNGTMYGWGTNSTGQVGNGTITTSVLSPVKVSLPVLKYAKAATAGTGQSLAIMTDGTLYSWGQNNNGQLGIGSTTNQSTPTQVTLPQGKSVQNVIAGFYHTMATMTDGSLYAWGNNGYGQLGIGNTTNQTTPTLVSNISANANNGSLGAANHTIVITTNGSVYSWGNNFNAQLGNLSTTQKNSPVQISSSCFTCTPTTSTFTVNACNSYTWAAKGNKVYTASNNTDTIHLTNASGCDSLVTLNLTVVSSLPAITGTSSACAGSTTTLNNAISGGVWFTQATSQATINASTGLVTAKNAGTITIKYSKAGCGSVTQSFTVNPIPAVPTITYAPGTVNPQAGAPTGGFCVGKTFTVVGTPSVPAGAWSATGFASITTGGVVNVVGTGAGSVKYTYTSAAGCSNSRTLSGSGYTCASRGVNTVDGQLSTVDGFTMYPNPAKGLINLNVESLIGKGSIVVTDLYGKTIKTQSLSMGTNTVDIANLSKGMYFVSTITNEGKTTKKLIVE